MKFENNFLIIWFRIRGSNQQFPSPLKPSKHHSVVLLLVHPSDDEGVLGKTFVRYGISVCLRL